MILINESERGKANSAMSFIFHHHTYLTFQKDDDFSFKQLVIILSLDMNIHYLRAFFTADMLMVFF